MGPKGFIKGVSAAVQYRKKQPLKLALARSLTLYEGGGGLKGRIFPPFLVSCERINGGQHNVFLFTTKEVMGTPDIEKKRILPPWMTKMVTEPTGLAKRRKKAALARTETIYCMNEAELVDMALCILAEDCKGKEAAIVVPEDDVPKPQHLPIDLQRSAGRSSKTNISTVGSLDPNKLEALGCSEKIKSEKDIDDDALKYVREIFFS